LTFFLSHFSLKSSVFSKGLLIKPGNERVDRSNRLLQVSPDLFETYFDYYIFIHLNRQVQILHVVGMCLGFLFITLAIVKWSWVFLVLHLITFNLIPLVSHWIYDGIMTPTASGAKLVSIWYAIKLNVWFMTGQQDKREKAFILKYPFTEAYYTK
jgi:hypothetical protein